MRRLTALILCVLLLAAPRPAAAETLDVTEVARGLAHPWALAFLPEGGFLVTERAGRLRRVSADGRLSAPLAGLPPIVAGGQGGLLDLVLDPDFARTGRIYFSYSEPREGGAGTSVAHATLGADRISNLTVIFRQQPSAEGNLHFGSRLVFARDGTLFVTLGERYHRKDDAQRLDNHLGKVIRIDREGRAPGDNPYAKRPGALPEIWSYGHRNAQGAALHPQTDELWLHEHGPRGGDELNRIRPGRNYGWPVITYGVDYSGAVIGRGETARAGMEQPLLHWVPSVAPSGMSFYTADRFPHWKGQIFLGTLRSLQVLRLVQEGPRVREAARYDIGARVRDLRQGPDGYLYALTDEAQGRILRLAPARPD